MQTFISIGGLLSVLIGFGAFSIKQISNWERYLADYEHEMRFEEPGRFDTVTAEPFWKSENELKLAGNYRVHAGAVAYQARFLPIWRRKHL